MRLTPLAWVLMVVVLACAALFVAGPSSAQTPALVIGLLVLLVALGGSLTGGKGGLTGKSLADRQAEFHAPRRDYVDAPAAEDEELWQREHERRERDGR